MTILLYLSCQHNKLQSVVSTIKPIVSVVNIAWNSADYVINAVNQTILLDLVKLGANKFPFITIPSINKASEDAPPCLRPNQRERKYINGHQRG